MAIEELGGEVMYLSWPSWAARSGLFECSLWKQFRGSEMNRSRGSRAWFMLSHMFFLEPRDTGGELADWGRTFVQL
jgi:hypothetical protein